MDALMAGNTSDATPHSTTRDAAQTGYSLDDADQLWKFVTVRGVRRGSAVICTLELSRPVEVVRPTFLPQESIVQRLMRWNYKSHKDRILVIDAGNHRQFAHTGENCENFQRFCPYPVFLKYSDRLEVPPDNILPVYDAEHGTLLRKIVETYLPDTEDVCVIQTAHNKLCMFYYGSTPVPLNEKWMDTNHPCFQVLLELCDEILTRRVPLNPFLSPLHTWTLFTEEQVDSWTDRCNVPQNLVQPRNFVQLMLFFCEQEQWNRLISALREAWAQYESWTVTSVISEAVEWVANQKKILDLWNEHVNKVYPQPEKNSKFKAAVMIVMIHLAESSWGAFLTDVAMNDDAAYEDMVRHAESLMGDKYPSFFRRYTLRRDEPFEETEKKRLDVLACLRLASQRSCFEDPKWREWKPFVETHTHDLYNWKIHWFGFNFSKEVNIQVMDVHYHNYVKKSFTSKLTTCDYPNVLNAPKDALGVLADLKNGYVSPSVSSWQYVKQCLKKGNVVEDCFHTPCSSWTPLFTSEEVWRRLPLAMLLNDRRRFRRQVGRVLELLREKTGKLALIAEELEFVYGILCDDDPPSEENEVSVHELFNLLEGGMYHSAF